MFAFYLFLGLDVFRAPARTNVLEEHRVIVDPTNQLHDLLGRQNLCAFAHAILEAPRLLLTEIFELYQQGMSLLQVVTQLSDFFALVQNLPSLLRSNIEFFDQNTGNGIFLDGALVALAQRPQTHLGKVCWIYQPGKKKIKKQRN